MENTGLVLSHVQGLSAFAFPNLQGILKKISDWLDQISDTLFMYAFNYAWCQPARTID